MMTTEQLEQGRPGIVDTGTMPVGAALRTRREQLGWTLPDVAAWLRIKLSYLEALEAGQVARLPGNTYAMGFLRAYSGVLGLDAEDMSRRFRHETKDVGRKPELSFPAPVPERGVPAGAVVLLGALGVIGAYVAWYEFTGHERAQPHGVPAVPAALLPNAGTTATPSASPQVATVMPGPGQVPSPLPQSAVPAQVAPQVAALVPAQAPAQVPAQVSARLGMPAAGPVAAVVAASTPPVSVPVAAGSVPAAVVAVPGVAAPAAAVVPAAPATAVPAAAAGQIVVKAVGASWVQVRQVGGKVIYDHVLQAGDSWPVPTDSGAVTLTTGNAGGIELGVDGVTTPVLGRAGAVRRAIPLDAASIRDGSVAAAHGSAVVPASAATAPVAPAPFVAPGAAPAEVPPVDRSAGVAPAPADGAAPAGTGSGGVSTTPARHARPGRVVAAPAAAGRDESADSLNARQLKATPQP